MKRRRIVFDHRAALELAWGIGALLPIEYRRLLRSYVERGVNWRLN